METVATFLDRIRAAWDAGDADSYSREFTEDASYVIFLGDALLGREAIRSSHHDVFTKHQKGTKMKVKVLQVHELCDTCVSVLTVGGIAKGDDILFDKFQTYSLTSTDSGKWICHAFQNTDMSSRSKKLYNAEL